MVWIFLWSSFCDHNWFFQFIYCCRFYLHQLFSAFITDEMNIVHFVLELIPWLHLFVLTWAFIQVFFLFWRNFIFFRCISLCIFFEVSLDIFDDLFQVVFFYHCYVLVPQFQTVRSHVSFLATFIAFKFTFFWRLFTSCLWYLTGIATRFLNRFGHMPIHYHLSGSASQCYSNHPLKLFYHILVGMHIAMHCLTDILDPMSYRKESLISFAFSSMSCILLNSALIPLYSTSFFNKGLKAAISCLLNE